MKNVNKFGPGTVVQVNGVPRFVVVSRVIKVATNLLKAGTLCLADGRYVQPSEVEFIAGAQTNHLFRLCVNDA